jgi:very-short-patch-repair endonuclease
VPDKSPITQQHVNAAKYQRAKEMRREMTLAERTLWNRLRAGRLAGIHFRRQQIIEPYIVDFYCHEAALVVEVDGEIHFGQQEYDRLRDQDLEQLGFKVLRFNNHEIVDNLEGVLTKILAACRIVSS